MEIMSYQDLQEQATEITLQNICEDRIKLKGKGLTAVTIDPVFKRKVATDAAKLIGGRHNTRATLIDKICGPQGINLYHETLEKIKLNANSKLKAKI